MCVRVPVCFNAGQEVSNIEYFNKTEFSKNHFYSSLFSMTNHYLLLYFFLFILLQGNFFITGRKLTMGFCRSLLSQRALIIVSVLIVFIIFYLISFHFFSHDSGCVVTESVLVRAAS